MTSNKKTTVYKRLVGDDQTLINTAKAKTSEILTINIRIFWVS